MDNPRIIHAPMNGRRYTVTAPITQYDYGYLLLPEGTEELPATYEIDFSNDEHKGTSLTVYGDSEGAEVPEELIRTGKDVFAFYYKVGDGYGKTDYTWRIPNHCRPDRDGGTPTPSQQSSIDQLIVRSNEAVEQAEQSASDASTSAQNASADAERAEEARTDAQNYATQAEQSATDAHESASQASASATASANSASQSAQIKSDVEDLADDAQGYAQASAQSATASANSASQASASATSAIQASSNASDMALSAQTYSEIAQSHATQAGQSAQTASTKATESANSASQASGYAQTAESAKTASQTAQGLAEQAQTGAETAQGKAEDAQEAAETAAASIQSSASQIAQNTADIADLQTDVAQNEADILKAFPTDSASGSIASFPDGADDIPLKSLIVDINPVQDLNGYDSPWVGGGGKNLLEVSEANIEKPSYYSGTWEGTTIADAKENSITVSRTNGQGGFAGVVIPNGLKAGTYTFSCDVPVTANPKSFYIGYTENGVFAGQKALMGAVASQTHPNKSFTLENDTDSFYIKMAGAASDVPLTFSHLQIESGNTATSFVPYENICPISGWTGMTVNATGVNVFDGVFERGTFKNNGAPANSTTRLRTGFIRVQQDYVFITVPTANVVINEIYKYDANKQYISKKAPSSASNVVEIGSNVKYIRFSVRYSDNSTITLDDGVQALVKFGRDSTDYESYNGTTLPISWQTEAGTVYGGKLDVLTGKLTVYPYYASYNGETLTGGWISDRDVYAVGTTPTIGAQVVNIGAQGTEYQLEPHEVASLLGANNIFVDTGDCTVEYRADTKLYINRLTEPDADMIADSAITSGQFFMIGNSLYRALANIASGATITVGTNAQRVSLSDALNLVNA